MATTDNLEEFIQSIVNAVGEKTGDSEINAQDLPDKIKGISTPTSHPFSYFVISTDNTSGKLYVQRSDGSSAKIEYSEFVLHLPYKYKLHNNTVVEGEILFCDTNSTEYKKMTPEGNVYYSTNNSDSKISFSITDITNGDVSLVGYYPIYTDKIYATYGGKTSSIIEVSTVNIDHLTIKHTPTYSPTDTTIGGKITIFFKFKTDK